MSVSAPNSLGKPLVVKSLQQDGNQQMLQQTTTTTTITKKVVVPPPQPANNQSPATAAINTVGSLINGIFNAIAAMGLGVLAAFGLSKAIGAAQEIDPEQAKDSATKFIKTAQGHTIAVTKDAWDALQKTWKGEETSATGTRQTEESKQTPNVQDYLKGQGLSPETIGQEHFNKLLLEMKLLWDNGDNPYLNMLNVLDDENGKLDLVVVSKNGGLNNFSEKDRLAFADKMADLVVKHPEDTDERRKVLEGLAKEHNLTGAYLVEPRVEKGRA